MSSHSPSRLPEPLTITHVLSALRDLPVLDITYKWNRMLCGLGVWLLRLEQCLQGSSTLEHISGPHSSLWLGGTPLYGPTTFHDPFISWCTFGLFPFFVCFESCCYEAFLGCTHFCVDISVLFSWVDPWG